MIRRLFPLSPVRLASLGFLTLLAACGGLPDKGQDARPREAFHVDFGGGITLDYEIERKQRQDGRACYAFLTGTLSNGSNRGLSQRTQIDFNVFHQGRQLFRDTPNLLNDVPPGGRVAFEMVDSPVHRGQCPAYDPIEVSLRKVLLP